MMEQEKETRMPPPREEVPIEKQPLLKPALSLLGAHAGGILIALILCFALSGIMANWGLLIAIPVIFLVYCMPIYGTTWAMGMSDSNKAHFGHIVLDPWRGAKIALITMIPWFLSGLLFLLSKFGLFYNFTVIFKIINAELWPIFNAVQVFAGQPVSMYLPDFSYFQVILCFIFTLLPVAAAQVGYTLGVKDISLTQKIVYKSKKQPVKEEKKSSYEQYQERQHGGASPAESQKEKKSLMQRILYKNDDEK